MSEKIVVIGGVAAGPKAACRVKRLLPDAEVVVITAVAAFHTLSPGMFLMKRNYAPQVFML